MSALDDLLAVMARLRDPAEGCPWDLQQTFASIVPHTLEEAYEVADAIERDDREDMRDELGDLLFQVVFYARLGEEEGSFDFDSIAAGVRDKLIRRHPHVFGEAGPTTAEGQRASWEAIKADERLARTSGQTVPGHLMACHWRCLRSRGVANYRAARRESGLSGRIPGRSSIKCAKSSMSSRRHSRMSRAIRRTLQKKSGICSSPALIWRGRRGSTLSTRYAPVTASLKDVSGAWRPFLPKRVKRSRRRVSSASRLPTKPQRPVKARNQPALRRA